MVIELACTWYPICERPQARMLHVGRTETGMSYSNSTGVDSVVKDDLSFVISEKTDYCHYNRGVFRQNRHVSQRKPSGISVSAMGKTQGSAGWLENPPAARSGFPTNLPLPWVFPMADTLLPQYFSLT